MQLVLSASAPITRLQVKAHVCATEPSDPFQGGGRVGCWLPGQIEIRTSSTTVAPNPIMCAHPRWPPFQAVHATKTTMARTTIMVTNRIFFVDMAAININKTYWAKVAR